MRFKPAQTVAVVNQKGGCGKTTTAVSLAAAFAQQGFLTCLVDIDSQCNATSIFDVDHDQLRREGRFTVLDAYLANRPARDIELRFPSRFDDALTLVPGHRALEQAHFKLEADLKAQLVREDNSPFDEDDIRQEHRQRLKKSLASLRDAHDFIVIDTPPALDFLLTTGLIAADWYLIPVFASGYDLDALAKLTATVKKVRERANPHLGMLGVVLSNFDTTTTLDKDVFDKLSVRFGEFMCKTTINRSVNHREATVYRKTIYEHASNSQAAKQYLTLAQEVLGRVQRAVEKHPAPELSVTEAPNA